MRAVLIALLVASVALSGCIERHTFDRCNERRDEPSWNDDGTGTICVDSRLRTFLYEVPNGTEAEAADGLPLLIALHGGAGDAENMLRKTRLGDWSSDEGFVLIVPDGTPITKFDSIRTWNAAHCCGKAREAGTNDVAFLDALVAAADDQHGLDMTRLGVTGHSNGGMMAHAYGARSDYPTHIMPVAGSIGGRSPVDGPLEQIPIPLYHPPDVLIIHAEDDPRVPYDGGEGENLGVQRYDMSVADAVEFWQASGTIVELVTVHGGHGWPGGEADLAAAPSDPDASRLVVEFLLDESS